MEFDTTQLINRLASVRFNRAIFTQYGPTDPEATKLRTQLTVLRAVRFVSPEAEQRSQLWLLPGPITQHAMSALRDCLPAWEARLVFNREEWPLEPSEYSHFAHCVPVSYWKVRVKLEPDSPVVAAVCEGLNARRAELGLCEPVLLGLDNVFGEHEVGEHVVLVYAWSEHDE